MEARYILPYTDFGFKHLFGSEPNKDLLISFLNALLQGEQVITDLTYLNNEHLGATQWERKAIFDVYCKNDKGEYFIVEMQNAYQKFFKDRSLFYSTFPIREQAKQGDWDFELKAVYTVGLLNFVFDEDKDSKDYYHHEVKLMDVKRKKVFYDKLTLIYLELPKFNKTEDELVTMMDKWMYVLKNVSRLLDRPASLRDRIFTRFFEVADIKKFTPEDMLQYEASLKAYRDNTNTIKTAEDKGVKKGMELGLKKGIEKGLKKGRKEGLEKGKAEGQKAKAVEIARNMKQKGMDTKTIADITGLTAKEIKNL